MYAKNKAKQVVAEWGKIHGEYVPEAEVEKLIFDVAHNIMGICINALDRYDVEFCAARQNIIEDAIERYLET